MKLSSEEKIGLVWFGVLCGMGRRWELYKKGLKKSSVTESECSYTVVYNYS